MRTHAPLAIARIIGRRHSTSPESAAAPRLRRPVCPSSSSSGARRRFDGSAFSPRRTHAFWAFRCTRFSSVLFTRLANSSRKTPPASRRREPSRVVMPPPASTCSVSFSASCAVSPPKCWTSAWMRCTFFSRSRLAIALAVASASSQGAVGAASETSPSSRSSDCVAPPGFAAASSSETGRQSTGVVCERPTQEVSLAVSHPRGLRRLRTAEQRGRQSWHSWCRGGWHGRKRTGDGTKTCQGLPRGRARTSDFTGHHHHAAPA